MSAAATMSNIIEAVRIVSLPCELQTTCQVGDFITNGIGLGTVASVNIVNMQTDAGMRYRSAFVDILEWADDAMTVHDTLLQGKEGVSISMAELDVSFHFDNGKSMTHLRFSAAKKHSPSTTPLELEEGEWNSIYIPFVPEDLEMDNGDMRYSAHDTLSEFFEDQLKIGQVDRIDFSTRTISGREDKKVRSAYVHFNHWYNNRTALLVRKTICDKGEFMCNGFYDGFEFCKFDRNRYITFKVNYKPIPTVTEDLNIHQLVAAKTNLEVRIAELEAKVAELEKKNDELAKYENFYMEYSG